MTDVLIAATWGLLMSLLLLALILEGPSEADLQKACKGHGKIVSYAGADIWSVDGGPRVVCSDGAVKYVEE